MNIKRCPFCGCARVWIEEGEIYPASKNYGGERWYEVGCKICGGRMVGFGKEAVIRAWNRRAHEEVVEHEV